MNSGRRCLHGHCGYAWPAYCSRIYILSCVLVVPGLNSKRTSSIAGAASAIVKNGLLLMLFCVFVGSASGTPSLLAKVAMRG